MEKKIVQTAGRKSLGQFAPEFAHYNDDVLFGEDWNNEDIDLKTRCIITVVALMASGITDSSLKYHLMNAKEHGVTQKGLLLLLTVLSMSDGQRPGQSLTGPKKSIQKKNKFFCNFDSLKTDIR